MKKGSENLVTKYVYRRLNGVYYRDHSVRWSDSLSHYFPEINKVASYYNSFKLCMSDDYREVTSWIDKHKNVIVRVIDKTIIQTKINF